MLGAQHALDPLTTVKACVNIAGIALIQHGWHPKSFITISREINSRAIEKSSKITGSWWSLREISWLIKLLGG